MDAVPTVNAFVVTVATPLVSVTAPSDAFPFLNVMVPAGVPLNCPVRVAAKVTDCPTVEGFSDEASATVVGAWFTIWLSTEEVLPEKLMFPLYTALMEAVLVIRLVLVRVATPFASVALPRDVLPFSNVTVPVGVPDVEEDTVAVNVTDCP